MVARDRIAQLSGMSCFVGRDLHQQVPPLQSLLKKGRQYLQLANHHHHWKPIDSPR